MFQARLAAEMSALRHGSCSDGCRRRVGNEVRLAEELKEVDSPSAGTIAPRY